MSSTESSGASAENTATNPASDAAFPSFGSTRGSGLARGKGKRPSAPAPATTASTTYTPTAIEVVTAPREYTNPFAPVNPEPVERVETPAAVTAPTPTVSADVPAITESAAPVPVASSPVSAEASANMEPAELNILEPEQQKHSPAQTWESEGFRPAREQRSERPRREESRRDDRPAEPFDPASIPEKFLYVRPGHTYVPTPTNYGGAPRERSSAPRGAYAQTAGAAPAAPQKSGGFLGWLKSLFGGSPSPAPVTAGGQNGEARREGGEHRRHRGGRNRGGDRAGNPGGQGGGEGGRGRSRGGRGRSGGGYRSEGSSQGGI